MNFVFRSVSPEFQPNNLKLADTDPDGTSTIRTKRQPCDRKTILFDPRDD